MEVFSSPLQRNGAMWCITRHPTLEGAREPQQEAVVEKSFKIRRMQHRAQNEQGARAREPPP